MFKLPQVPQRDLMAVNVGKISLVVDLVAMVQTIAAAWRETGLMSSSITGD